MRSLTHLLLLLLLLLFGTAVRAQESPSPAATPSPSSSAAAIPIAEVSESAASALAYVRGLEGTAQTDPGVQEVESGLDGLAVELEGQLRENAQLLAGEPTLEQLSSRQAGLQELAASLARSKTVLDDRATVLEEALGRLDGLVQVWTTTRTEAVAQSAPPIVMERVDEVLDALQDARERLLERQGALFALQTRLADQEARLADGLAGLAAAREARVGQVLAQDAQPLWRLDLFRARPGSLLDRLGGSLDQGVDPGQYASRRGAALAGYVVVFGLLILGLRWAGRKAQPWVADDPDIHQAMLIFDRPISTAALITLTLFLTGEPTAPRVVQATAAAAALLPAIVLLRRILAPWLLPLLNLLVLLVLVDQIRLLCAPVPGLARLVLMLETLVGMLFLAWFVRPGRYTALPEERRADVRARAGVLCRVVFGLLAGAALANFFGFVGLATLLANGTLRSSYIAVLVLAVLRIFQGLALFGLHVPPLALSRAVREHRPLLKYRTDRFLQFLALVVWGLVTLEIFSVREPVMATARAILGAHLAVGALSISLGGVLTFGLAVWAATLISRFLRFVLEEDVFPRLPLHRGIPHALSLTVHYGVLTLGFLAALAAVGLDLTKFSVLAGALGVGIGFGLQNVVNNFVSGLILLFDRSLSVGDIIEFGTHQGELVRIGLRASAVKLFDGRELIVPNADLMEEKVINGTPAGSPTRRMEFTFSLASEADSRQLLEDLKSLGKGHPDVATDPEPFAQFLGYVNGDPTWQLLAWTYDVRRAHLIRSELAVRLSELLQAAGHRVAAPRRDVALRGGSAPAAPSSVGE